MGASLSYPNVDLSGKVALVTGGNTGIGYETAKALARMGAYTFIGCRSQERAEQAIGCMKDELGQTQGGSGASPALKEDRGSHQRIGEAENKTEGKVSTAEEASSSEVDTRNKERRTSATSWDNSSSGDDKNGDGGEVKIEYLPLDLASFQSTKECVRLFKERNLPLHILVNNAAVAWIPFSMTDDGYETQFQVNHLGPMLLTLELLPVLVSTAQSCGDGRIAFVSSKTNSVAESVEADKLLVTREEDYNRLRTYPNTKLYNIMVGEVLQQTLADEAITLSSPEPGTVKTELHRGLADKKVITFLNKVYWAVRGRTPAEGAATSINCVVNPQLNSRQHFYYSDCRPARANSEAYDQAKQDILWKKSIEIIKDHLSSDILEKYGSGTERPKRPDILQSKHGHIGESQEKSLNENTTQESLPVEPTKTLNEEQEVNPSGDQESLPEPTKTRNSKQNDD